LAKPLQLRIPSHYHPADGWVLGPMPNAVRFESFLSLLRFDKYWLLARLHENQTQSGHLLIAGELTARRAVNSPQLR
jgi:hypothetical protein